MHHVVTYNPIPNILYSLPTYLLTYLLPFICLLPISTTSTSVFSIIKYFTY